MLLSITDLLIAPFYLALIFFIGRYIQKAKIKSNPVYAYYVKGLMMKVFGGIALCLIYTFYYNGGDTTSYFYDGASIMVNLFYKTPSGFFSIIFGDTTAAKWSLFDFDTMWPSYWHDHNSFFVVKVTAVIALFTMKSYVATTIVLACLSYTGVWRLYLVFTEEFPQYSKQLAIAILFIPSVAFWGSGILKDTITIAGVGWYTYAFYKFFIKRERFIINGFRLVIASTIVIAVKPYILFALLPGSLLWLSASLIKKVKNVLFRQIITPIITTLFVGTAYLLLVQLGSNLGKYSLDHILEKAVVTQQDLIRDYYGTNSFNIGTFDASLTSMLSKAPIAVVSGLFRPFLWEVRNPLMLMSAVENIYILYLTLNVLFTIPFFKIVGVLRGNPIVFFSILFAICFSFSVGLTTANFGALVRYRIPDIPFFVASLFIIKSIYLDRSTKLELIE